MALHLIDCIIQDEQKADANVVLHVLLGGSNACFAASISTCDNGYCA